MNLAVIIATYQRKDGRTPELLRRALKSVQNQLHTDYKIFLIGDRYEDNEEFELICNEFSNKKKLYFENLEVAVERDFFDEKIDIWKFGGVNAINYAIEMAKNDGFNYIVKLDHDDFWTETHLKNISECIESTGCAFVCTKSFYRKKILPDIQSDMKYIPFLPHPERLVHSSICIDLKQIPIKYRTLGDEKCEKNSSDGCLYFEIQEIVNKNNLTSLLINDISCVVETDSYFLNSDNE